MNIKIDYNTISFVSQISCSDKTIHGNLEQTIKDNKDKRITEWFETFINRIKEESNNDNFSIEVNGCDTYEKGLIESILERENGLIDRKKIEFVAEIFIKNEYKNIDAFVDYALNSKDGILEDAIKPKILDIERLRSNKVEVPVIATMSSGKSTLLNAIIGQNLLFEDTGTATSTTCNIKINNKLKEFVAQAIDGEKIIDSSSTNISGFLEKWNSNANTRKFSNLKLNLEGPVKDLNSSNLELNFIDTPGPNSAKNKDHKEKTFSYLKDNEKIPIVLYVLDPEKMESNDDDLTLKEISDVLKNNKQNLDRIIFIYNKVDLEVEKKTFNDVLVKIHKFLKKYEIENPKIFPISSKYAKLAQLNRALSYIEEGDLDNYKRKFIPVSERNHLGYPFLEHTPLNGNQKEQLKNKITKGGLDADMVYSGLAAIRLYIEDYITNHHQKNQYQKLIGIAYNVFDVVENKIKLEKQNLEERSADEQKKNKERTENEIKELNIKKTEAIRAIGKIELNKKFIYASQKKLDDSFDRLKTYLSSKEEISVNEANQLRSDTNTIISDLGISLKTDLMSKMNDEQQSYLLKLKKVVADRFELQNPSLENKTFNAELFNRINVLKITSIDNYKRTEIENKQREVEKQVKSTNWFKKLFGMTDTITVIESYVEKRTVIKVAELRKDLIGPIIMEFTRIINKSASDFDKMFLDYNNSFKNLVDFSFQESIDSVYKKSNRKVELSNIEKRHNLESIDRISQDISNFKKI